MEVLKQKMLFRHSIKFFISIRHYKIFLYNKDKDGIQKGFIVMLKETYSKMGEGRDYEKSNQLMSGIYPCLFSHGL